MESESWRYYSDPSFLYNPVTTLRSCSGIFFMYFRKALLIFLPFHSLYWVLHSGAEDFMCLPGFVSASLVFILPSSRLCSELGKGPMFPSSISLSCIFLASHFYTFAMNLEKAIAIYFNFPVLVSAFEEQLLPIH